jgi:hypothetical protein
MGGQYGISLTTSGLGCGTGAISFRYSPQERPYVPRHRDFCGRGICDPQVTGTLGKRLPVSWSAVATHARPGGGGSRFAFLLRWLGRACAPTPGVGKEWA